MGEREEALRRGQEELELARASVSERSALLLSLEARAPLANHTHACAERHALELWLLLRAVEATARSMLPDV